MVKVLVSVMISETPLIFDFENLIDIEKVFEIFDSDDLDEVIAI